MRVTFLGHSGFLVESESASLLFDWWKGTLPALPEAPLFCFASHKHPDHFDPRIFSLAQQKENVTFILAHDIRLSPRNLAKWRLTPEAAAQCISLRSGEKIVLPGLTVETFPSTDEGVAFLVTLDGRSIYHAGDLNWWHWEGEDSGWNRNMEVDFKRYIEPLRHRHIDLAFAPLDARLEKSADWGFHYLLKIADVERILPMHQWEDFTPTARFCQAHPELAEKVVAVERPGQSWTFS